jgi:hypothetical protein
MRRERCSVRCPQRIQSVPPAVSSAEESGRYSNATIVIDLVWPHVTSGDHSLNQVRSLDGSRADSPGKIKRLPRPG